MSANPLNHTVTSADGSTIAYDLVGQGPLIILVAPALADRRDHRKLAALLAEDHTVINYDRRGRGTSTEASPWAKEREIEDIATLIEAHGGTGAVFGASSGAVLALDATQSLPAHISKVISFEAPIIVDDERAPIAADLADRLRQLVEAGKRPQAVSTFMREALDAPAATTAAMRLMIPVWRDMVAMAQTTVYDATLCAGLQSGRTLPHDKWTDLRVPTLTLVGHKSPAWAHSGAAAIAQRLGTRPAVVPKAHHASPTMRPALLMPQLREFLNR